MYILQISDLHISSNCDVDVLEKKLIKLCEKLEHTIERDSQLVCCILGDIVNKGDAVAYECAGEVLEMFKSRLTTMLPTTNVDFEVIPGNHDLCVNADGRMDLSAFNAFATKLLNKKTDYSDEKSIIKNKHFEYYFISASSVLKSEKDFGQLDYESLGNCVSHPNTIMLTHHALVSGDNEDTAAIRNGYRLQQYLEDENVITLLHGHTHGCKRYTVGNHCQVIGVGPMFKQEDDISNQCNLVCISGSFVSKITTFKYQGDRETWDTINTYERVEDNNYYGKSVFDVYMQVLQDAEANKLLPNLRIQIKQDFETFEKEIEDKFSECAEDANAWQAITPPEDLDYTHGQLMCDGSNKWEEFVISSLKAKPTSKRTIIPLIDKKMSYKGGDGKLVSFNIVQFGFTDDSCIDLHITVYFRALEVRHFLPINLFEVYLMAQKIRNSIRTISRITVCLFAFKAEAKQNYGCYKKSTLDLISESQLCKLLSEKNYAELRTHINEKAAMGDTVIDDVWLIRLKNALSEFYNHSNKETVLRQVEVVSSALGILKSERARCSDYSATQLLENDFNDALLKLAELLPEI